MSFSYRIYGLEVESSVSIAGLESNPRSSYTPDLYFSHSDVPDWVAFAAKLPARLRKALPSCEETNDPRFVLTEHGDEQYFELSYSDGARFVIDGFGKQVWGSFGPELTSQDFAQYFLGPVMGFVLRRRRMSCLHASSAVLRQQAAVFCGDAGAGKSTLAAALALRGVPILSDDIVPLVEADGQFYAVPGCPRVCLWPESVTELWGSPELLPKLIDSWEKRYLPLDGKGAIYVEDKVRLGMIYLIAPRVADKTAPRIEEISPRDALLGLATNTYMNWLLDRKSRAAEFEELGRAVLQIPARRIVPHVELETLSVLADLILADAEAHMSAFSPKPTRSELSGRAL